MGTKVTIGFQVAFLLDRSEMFQDLAVEKAEKARKYEKMGFTELAKVWWEASLRYVATAAKHKADAICLKRSM